MEVRPNYRINSPTVVIQIIDGEAILIHFESGTYYSTTGVGSQIVQGIDEGASRGAIVRELCAAHNADPAAAALVVDTFLERLVGEELIVANPEGGLDHEDLGSISGGPVPLAAPELEKYTDLEDLLLLDPIHDTDDTGWPVAAPDGWQVPEPDGGVR